jgi:hypothetical protein
MSTNFTPKNHYKIEENTVTNCDVGDKEWNKIMTCKNSAMGFCQQLSTEKPRKTPIFCCTICNFSSHNKKDYNKHLLTAKHRKNEKINAPSTEKKPNDISYTCLKCCKEYSCRSGLWRHQQKCDKDKNECEYDTENENENENENEEKVQSQTQTLNNVISPELIMMLIQQNKELQNMMFELAKNGGTNHSHNTTTNIQNNKAFNMNFFLNETCKNAMNMSDFVKNLVVTTDDFEQTGILGYVEGISRIMENGLKKLEVHERPIHCSDVKRETIYIRENDKWEKDDEQKTKLLEAIKEVGVKNIQMIPQWCKEHPGWSDSDSKENDRYLKYVFNSMCGGTDDEIRNNYKCIMRHISRVTMMDKSNGINL